MEAAKKLEFCIDAACGPTKRGLDERRHLEQPKGCILFEKHDVQRNEARSDDARGVTVVGGSAPCSCWKSR
jgi:hypothetical protein